MIIKNLPAPGSSGAWLLAVRPVTLPASVAPVLLGWSLAALHGPVSVSVATACLVTALLLQISANLANDLWDALSGVDSKDRLGPVRVTQSGLLTQKQVAVGLALSLVLASVAGFYAVWYAGWWLLILGATCVIAALAYTAGPFPLSRLGMGEAAALIFFGPAACGGTYAVLTGTINLSVLTASLIPGLHAAAIMAVNNLRDISSDSRAGKKTLAVRVGSRPARYLAAALVLLGNLMVIPPALLLKQTLLLTALILIPLSYQLLRAILKTSISSELNPVLARTGRWELITCLVIAILLHLKI